MESVNKNVNFDPAEKPLNGVRILDLSHAYSGPFCTMHLADQGAEVIKIEVPGKGDQSRNWAPFYNGGSGYYSYINRNKYGLTLNLKADEGKEIFKKLVAESDVVVENFRVGTMEKLGLGYEVLKEINPGLIYASISGFGLEGPLAKRPCYDIVAQAMGGMMSVTGFNGVATKAGTSIADNYSGTYLSLGIVMALYQRSRTGQGRRIDVSMLDTIFSILETGVIDYTMTGKVNQPEGNRDPGIAPFDAFEAKDGGIVMACGSEGFWQELCRLMERTDLIEDPRFLTNADRCNNYSELRPIIAEWTQKFTASELEDMIVGEGIPFGRILKMDQVCKQDELLNRNMLWKVHDTSMDADIQIPGTPIKMHGCEDKVQRPAPVLGEHSEQILQDILKMDANEVNALKENGVI